MAITTGIDGNPPRGKPHYRPPQTRASGAAEPMVGTPRKVEARLPGTAQLLPDNWPITIWNPETVQYETYTYGDFVKNNQEMPSGLTYGNYREWIPDYGSPDDLDGNRSHSGVGSAVGPIYQKPDRRLVEESVKGMLSTLTGTVKPDQLNKLTDLYMNEHKRAWSVRKTEQVDPMETVKAEIRKTSGYKAIHQLRPDSMDEYEWVSSRQGALLRAGVTPQIAEKLGVAQATAGANTQEVTTAGNVATFSQSGIALNELKNRMSKAAYGALRLV